MQVIACDYIIFYIIILYVKMLTLIATRNTFKLCNITMVNNKYKFIKLKKCFLTKTKVPPSTACYTLSLL